MKKEYIRTEEMKELFTLVPTFKNIILSLKAELKRNIDYSKDSDNIYIEGMTFGSFELSDMPYSNTNETSDKTADIALNYKKIISNEKKEVQQAIKEIIREIYCIEVVLEKIEIGLNSLNQTHQEILKLKYWENRTWDEIIKYLKKQNVFYSKGHLQRIVKREIKKLNTIALIDLEIYTDIKALINNINNS